MCQNRQYLLAMNLDYYNFTLHRDFQDSRLSILLGYVIINKHLYDNKNTKESFLNVIYNNV